jgi:hypothetical protein
MRFGRRLATWAVIGFLQQVVLLGSSAAAALILLTVTIVGLGSLAIRAVLPTVDRHVERGWIEALGPLSTLADRYPPLEKNATARQVEVLAASFGISVAVDDDAAAPVPDPGRVDSYRAVRSSLLNHDLDSPRGPGRQTLGGWLRQHRTTVDALAGTLIEDAAPVWAMTLDDCVGDLQVKLAGLVELQRVLLAAADQSIRAGELDLAARLLEASWRLNDTIQRSPRLDEHLASVVVVEEQMAVLRNHPAPGNHWKVRLAAVDLERRALEAIRLDAWLLRCRAAAFLNDLHPVLGLFAQPFARLLAVPQHQAMVWAVQELPVRQVTSFDPDRFVAEQHRRIPRWNRLARSGLPESWDSWTDSVGGSLAVELGLRTLELREALSRPGGVDAVDAAPRQPSQVAGIEWIYTVAESSIEIAVDRAWRAATGDPPLRVTVPVTEPDGLEGTP